MSHIIMTLRLRRHEFLMFLILTLSYFSFGTYRNWPYKIESDGKYYYQYLVSVWFDHDLDFTNNYQAPTYDWMRTEIDLYKCLRPDRHALPINLFTCGPAILWTPFFAVAYILAVGLNAIGIVNIDMNPWSKYFQYTVMYAAVIYTLLSFRLLYDMLSRYFEQMVSQTAIALILFGTNLYYYVVFEVSMSHAYDFFTIVLFLSLLMKCRSHQRPLFYGLLGGAGALHVLVRTQNILTIGIFSIVLCYWEIRRKQRYLINIIVYICMLMIGMLPLFLINYVLFDHPFALPQGNQFFAPLHPKPLHVLFSLRNGLFSHHPLLLVGLVGFVYFLVRLNKNTMEFLVFVGMFTTFLSQVYINSIVSDWWAGHSFSQRRLIATFPLFVYGLAEAFVRFKVRFPNISTALYRTIIVLICLLGWYLTLIHVFWWDYEEPHHIFVWMTYNTPKILWDRWLQFWYRITEILFSFITLDV